MRWVRGPVVQIICQVKALRVGDQVIVRVKHSNRQLNNKVCVVEEVGEWGGAYAGREDCTYIASIVPLRPRTKRGRTRFQSGDLGVIAEDIVAWRRPKKEKA